MAVLQVLVLASIVLSGCTEPEGPLSRETVAMDTFLSVTIYDEEIDIEEGNRLIDSVFAEIRRIETLATDYSDESEIGRINLGAGRDTVLVSAEVAAMIRQSLRYSERTGGAFDITVGPLVRLWSFLAETPVVPPPDSIRILLPLVDVRSVVMEGETIYLSRPGMRLDLGGIAKGYAVDRAIGILRRNGIHRSIVDLGGNLGVDWDGTAGPDPGDVTVSVRHPRNDGAMFGEFRTGTAGIATSGDYQRYFVREGVRYHHLLDPRTGMPANDVVSVTVISEGATEADVLSTAVFVLGRERGIALIESMPGVEGIIIVEAGDSLRALVSSGLRELFLPVRADD